MPSTIQYRQFMLLVAIALSAVVALGFLPAVDNGAQRADAAPRVWTAAGASDAIADLSPSLIGPAAFLGPLLDPPDAERFRLIEFPASAARVDLADTQIVSYYGNPHTAAMGILGEASPEEIADRLEVQAEKYDRINGDTNVVPAIHLVYGVAQPQPTANGRYLQYLEDEGVQRYLDLVEEREMLLFIDLQIGRSSVEAELERVLPYLGNPRVHLALDPEFAVGPGEVPGLQLGGLDAGAINRAQAMLQELVEAEGLPPKLLMVHQFADSMVLQGESIERYPGVELIINMDGFGPAVLKRAQYERYSSRPYATHAGIKLFLQHDPDLMSERDVLALEPRPVVVVYQ